MSELCRREGITDSMVYHWRKEFLEAEKARLMGNTKRQATSDEVKRTQLAVNSPPRPTL